MMTAINNTIAALRARVERFTALIKELEAFREGESGCNRGKKMKRNIGRLARPGRME
jgi:hypothetical protein